MMWWAVWCAVVVCGTTSAAPADALPPLDLLQIDPPAPDDQESLNYVPQSTGGAHYSLSAPLYYYLDQMPRESQSMVSEAGERRARLKRKMPSLSINNPMEVLRQRLMLEVVRKQMREANQRQAVANRVFLQNVGKRGFWSNPAPSRYDN